MGAAADDDEDDELFAPFKKQLHEQVGCWPACAGWSLGGMQLRWPMAE